VRPTPRPSEVGAMSCDQLVTFLAGQPRAVAKLLAQHVDDGTGHCRACRVGQRGFLSWPCTIYTAAARAAGWPDDAPGLGPPRTSNPPTHPVDP
jgi:hypothetical protein